jgi:ABC-type lipoprotein export system ATPase subunit
MNKVECRHLGKRYGDRVLYQDVCLKLPEQGLVAIVGDSGCGKSTLLDLISGLDTDYSGEVLTLGVLLKAEGEDTRNNFRLREIGYLRQNCDLLELESAFDNVLLPLYALSGTVGRMEKRKAKDLLTSFGLEKKFHQRVNTLSGGERQRVALARALIAEPSLLLCDEPTGALDHENADLIYSYLASLSKKRLVIVVSHDEERSRRYADTILRLQNGTFSGGENLEKQAQEASLLTPSLAKGKSSHMPFFYWLRHSYHLLKAKKGRSLLSGLILSFSLLSFGLSLYVSRDLSKELHSAFSSLTGEGSVVMEKADKSAAPFNKILSAPEKDVQRILSSHPSLALGYGVSYIAPFESYFPQQNSVEILSGSHAYSVPKMSIRSVNDYLWMEEEAPSSFYPECPPLLEEDQVALGLPFSSMTGLCLSLQIPRTFESLGHYLQQNPLEIRFSMQNDSWGYYDVQSVRLLAIKESSVPTLYHYDRLWSSYFLEERMRFPTSDETDTSLPWIMQKVYYLEPFQTPEFFMREVREEEDLAPYVFERATYLLEQSHNEPKKATSLPRFYCYLTDKNSLSYSAIHGLSQESSFSSYQVTSFGSYVSYPEALTSGFAKPFYLSSSLSSIEKVVDAISIVPKGKESLELSLPSDTVSGSYLKPLQSALSYSSDFTMLKEGRIPEKESEVCLSSGLYSKLGLPSKVFVTGWVGEEEVGDRLEKDYRLGEVSVVGVVEEEKDVLFADSYWAIDFWRDEFGMSAFYLEPDKVIFHLKNASQSEKVAASLGKRYPSFRFIDPTSSVTSSIHEVVSYVELVLRLASGISLAISLLLLLTVALLSSLENKSEGRMLFVLGIKREDVAESHSANLLLLSLACFLSSATSLVFGEVVLDQSIRGNFGSGGSFVIDTYPFLGMGLVTLLGFVFSAFIIKNWVNKRNFRAEGR